MSEKGKITIDDVLPDYKQLKAKNERLAELLTEVVEIEQYLKDYWDNYNI